MHPLLIYIGSGWIFWGGVITLLVSCLSGIGAEKGWRLHLAQTAAVLGILQIALSSTPVPGWLWWLLLLATAGTDGGAAVPVRKAPDCARGVRGRYSGCGGV